jgi:hypothetical protein
MHEPINVKSPNNTSKWQMGFNSAFKGLTAQCLSVTGGNIINFLSYDMDGAIITLYICNALLLITG